MPIRVSLHPIVPVKDGSQFAGIVSPARIGLETLPDYMVKDTALARDDTLRRVVVADIGGI